MEPNFDIFIIGGGINGCGIARDAAGRGFKVGVVEMNDLASGTSSWSSKLIHGGLRYLEHYEFRLVREALSERELLLNMAPHIIWPMRFVLPHHKGLRPAWFLRLGLFLYDHIGKRKLLPGSKTVHLRNSETGKALKSIFTKGFEYSDCWVNDARLVVLNAMDAVKRGAIVETRTQCISARRVDKHWVVVTENLLTGKKTTRTARLVVNASGPWVDKVLSETLGDNKAQNVRMVQGSHIVVPKLYNHDRAYIFQNADSRIIFALPYEQNYTLIGTTDRDYKGEPSEVKITSEERAYLCAAASEYFEKIVPEDDIVWAYSGVRPLYDDGASTAQEATRDYVLRLDGIENEAPLLNIFGGKITTYRKLAESMLKKIEGQLGSKKPAWTENSKLPGGNFEVSAFETKVSEFSSDFPFLKNDHAFRLVRSYGTRAWTLMGKAKSMSDMGKQFGCSLTELEVDYLMQHEWAISAEDIVWRRSKLGIRMTDMEILQLQIWIEGRPPL